MLLIAGFAVSRCPEKLPSLLTSAFTSRIFVGWVNFAALFFDFVDIFGCRTKDSSIEDNDFMVRYAYKANTRHAPQLDTVFNDLCCNFVIIN